MADVFRKGLSAFGKQALQGYAWHAALGALGLWLMVKAVGA